MTKGGGNPSPFCDGILTNCNHIEYNYDRKNEKLHHKLCCEGLLLNIDKEHIEQYLTDVKNAVELNRYRIERNSNRQDNIDLFLDYVIDEEMAKGIILDLTVMDFSEVLQNKHQGYEHEWLYVFGKDVDLLERYGDGEKTVPLYITGLATIDFPVPCFHLNLPLCGLRA